MKILHIIPSVNPKGGGPIEGIKQLGAQLRHMGHFSEVASLDNPDDHCTRDFPLPLHPLGPSFGKYAYAPRAGAWLRSNADRYDAVIVNGIWQYPGLLTRSALSSLGVPYYVFPHGMLDPWFKERYPIKHLKKWIYWLSAEYRVLRDATKVFFTCEQERVLARNSFWLYQANESVIKYGIGSGLATDIGVASRKSSECADKGKYFLYLSRLHEKKGLEQLLPAFAKFSKTHPAARLVIAGTGKEGYVSKLKELVRQLGLESAVLWAGMVEGRGKEDLLRGADAFILPSHQENFGIAVVEALARGVPVLITDKVNIWREISDARAGIIAEDTEQGILGLFSNWAGMSQSEKELMGVRARVCYAQNFTVEAMASDLVSKLTEERG